MYGPAGWASQNSRQVRWVKLTLKEEGPSNIGIPLRPVGEIQPMYWPRGSALKLRAKAFDTGVWAGRGVPIVVGARELTGTLTPLDTALVAGRMIPEGSPALEGRPMFAGRLPEGCLLIVDSSKPED
jgi:hypothetical protein